MKLENMTWPEVEALSREEVVLIPTGSLEQHGAHFPALDGYGCAWKCDRLGELVHGRVGIYDGAKRSAERPVAVSYKC